MPYVENYKITTMTPHEEIGAVLRSAIRGDIKCSAPKELTNWCLDSEPTFKIGEWELDCFVESDWIEDIYEARAPDGRKINFSPSEENSDISLFLSDQEVEQLCLKLGRLPR